jgi:hypothetical protein
VNALTRKVGPLPVWAWAVIVAVVGYVLYRRFSSSSSAATQLTSSATPQQTAASPDSSLGLSPSAGSPSDTGQTTSDLVTALGGQQSNLLAALEAVNQDVVGLAQSQLASLQTQTTAGSFQTQTDASVASQPGGANAPIVYYLSPTVANTPTTPAPTNAVVTSAQTKPTRYYTYKSSVPLAHGQTVHFLTGKGYYAA